MVVERRAEIITVVENVIFCDRYGCHVSEELDVPLNSFLASPDGTYEVRRWFAALGWRSLDAGHQKRMADVCPRHVEVQKVKVGSEERKGLRTNRRSIACQSKAGCRRVERRRTPLRLTSPKW